MKKLIRSTVVSAVGLGIGAAVMAQSQPNANIGDAKKEDASSAGEIIVSVQRRNEILSQTPLAASVISGAALTEKNVVTVDGLQFISPSVVVNNYGQGLNFNIRGIGKAESSAMNTTGVITYRDGIPSFPGYFQGEPYYDVSNIQILRGPQGTVVGQNSTGGAVFVNTKNPVIGGEKSGYISGSLGNYSGSGLQGAINLPVSETFAARVAFYEDQRKSFYKVTGPNGSEFKGNPGDFKNQAARISFLWAPTDEFSVIWKTDSVDTNNGSFMASKPQSSFSTIPGTNTPNPYYNNNLFNVSANALGAARDKYTRHNLKAEYVTENGTKFRSISGYSKGTTKWISDFDGTANGIPAIGPWVAVPGNKTTTINADETQLSQEFNIISPDNQQWSWVLGAFAVKNHYDFPSPDGTFEINYDTALAVGPYAPYFKYQFNGRVAQESNALFGQVGYAISPNLKIDVGARSTSSSANNNLKTNQLGTFFDQNQTVEERNTSYKVSLGWKLNSNNYVYATHSTGFKPGGMNLKVAQVLPASPFAKEEIKASELGWKSTFDEGKGHLNLTGYMNDYKGFQVSIGNPAGPTFPIIGNATGTTKVSGIEAEADYKMGALTLGGGIGIVNSSLGQFFAVDQRFLTTIACNSKSGPSSSTCIDLTGRQLTYAPSLTYNLSAKYDMSIWDGKLTAAVNLGHVSSQWASLFQNVISGDRLNARNILGGQLTYQSGKSTVTVYGTNLTNQQYVAAHWLASSGNLDFAGPPRQFGIRLAQTF